MDTKLLGKSKCGFILVLGTALMWCGQNDAFGVVGLAINGKSTERRAYMILSIESFGLAFYQESGRFIILCAADTM